MDGDIRPAFAMPPDVWAQLVPLRPLVGVHVVLARRGWRVEPQPWRNGPDGRRVHVWLSRWEALAVAWSAVTPAPDRDGA